MATDAKVDTELADEIDQTGWTYTYAWNPSKDSYTTKGGMLVSSKEGFKTSQINLFSFERPHMRGFHCASARRIAVARRRRPPPSRAARRSPSLPATPRE